MNSYDKMRAGKKAQDKAENASAAADVCRPGEDLQPSPPAGDRPLRSSFELPNGQVIEFRALRPMDFQIFQGAALDDKMTELGLDTQDTELRSDFYTGLTYAERMEILIESAKVLVVQAVTRPKLTVFEAGHPKRDVRFQRSEGKVSINDALTPTDILSLNDAIKEFSGVHEEEEMFREASEADAENGDESDAPGSAEHADGSVDGAGVQPESL